MWVGYRTSPASKICSITIWELDNYGRIIKASTDDEERVTFNRANTPDLSVQFILSVRPSIRLYVLIFAQHYTSSIEGFLDV